MEKTKMLYSIGFFLVLCLVPTAFGQEQSFILYTRTNPSNGYVINQTKVNGSPFNASKRMIILIGGFNYSHTYLSPTKDQILRDNDAMVLIVNWDNYNTEIINMLSNIDSLARQLADFLKYLRNNKAYKENKIWMYGFSMGGHYAGMVGQKMNPLKAVKFDGTIVGMDVPPPAWEAFFFIILLANKSPPTSLDITDARFVYGIHSSYGGQQANYGHTDVYMNGGLNQPKCASLPVIEELGCSHSQSFDGYWATVSSNLQATKCTNYQQAQNQLCVGPATVTFSKYFIQFQTSGVFYLNYES